MDLNYKEIILNSHSLKRVDGSSKLDYVLNIMRNYYENEDLDGIETSITQLLQMIESEPIVHESKIISSLLPEILLNLCRRCVEDKLLLKCLNLIGKIVFSNKIANEFVILDPLQVILQIYESQNRTISNSSLKLLKSLLNYDSSNQYFAQESLLKYVIDELNLLLANPHRDYEITSNFLSVLSKLILICDFEHIKGDIITIIQIAFSEMMKYQYLSSSAPLLYNLTKRIGYMEIYEKGFLALAMELMVDIRAQKSFEDFLRIVSCVLYNPSESIPKEIIEKIPISSIIKKLELQSILPIQTESIIVLLANYSFLGPEYTHILLNDDTISILCTRAKESRYSIRFEVINLFWVIASHTSYECIIHLFQTQAVDVMVDLFTLDDDDIPQILNEAVYPVFIKLKNADLFDCPELNRAMEEFYQGLMFLKDSDLSKSSMIASDILQICFTNKLNDL